MVWHHNGRVNINADKAIGQCLPAVPNHGAGRVFMHQSIDNVTQETKAAINAYGHEVDSGQ
jgi:hypothetical protein